MFYFHFVSGLSVVAHDVLGACLSVVFHCVFLCVE